MEHPIDLGPLYVTCTAELEGAPATCPAEVRGPSARPVELPWVARQLHHLAPRRVLDIGLSLADLCYLRMLLDLRIRHGVELHALDIVPPARVRTRYPAAWWPEITAIPFELGDVRVTAPHGRDYDVVTCVSVIEHIGYDVPSAPGDMTSAFSRARRPEDVDLRRPARTDTDVLEALCQLLRPGGALLLTVPAGSGQPVILRDSLGFYCAQHEYDAAGWNHLLSHPGLEPVEQKFYRLSERMEWHEVPDIAALAGVQGVFGSHSCGCALALLRRT